MGPKSGSSIRSEFTEWRCGKDSAGWRRDKRIDLLETGGHFKLLLPVDIDRQERRKFAHPPRCREVCDRLHVN
jgi:hypothetical protein